MKVALQELKDPLFGGNKKEANGVPKQFIVFELATFGFCMTLILIEKNFWSCQ
jgi:hypothetical protein